MSDVSVIIPAWNAAATLAATVQSALAQTIAPLEILVCDDGSTDDSAQVISGIEDSRVVWLPGLHSGSPGGPRNRGLRASRGEWLAFCDSDDVWLPQKIEQQLDAARQAQCLAASTNAYSIRPGPRTEGVFLSWAMPLITFHDLMFDNPVVCSSALFHRSIYDEVEGFTEDYALRSVADYTLWLRVATFTPFAYVAAPLVNYWNNPDGSLRSQDDDHWTQKFMVFANYLQWADASALPEPRKQAAAVRVRLRQLVWEYRRRKLRMLAGAWKRKWLR